ncbi:MAG: hypothetical protein ACOC44_19125 [Promethearchaeia archaeon]
MNTSGEKKNLNLSISSDLLKKVNLSLVREFGNTFGHISTTVEDALKLWLEKRSTSGEAHDE